MECHDQKQEKIFPFLFEQMKNSSSKSGSMELCEFIKQLKHFEVLTIQEQKVNGRTLLQYACEQGLVDYVRSILDLNINPNVVNTSDGKSAILYAAEGSHPKILELFIHQARHVFDTKSTRQSFDSSDCFAETLINFKAITNKHENILHVILQRPKLVELSKRRQKLSTNATQHEIQMIKRQWRIINMGYLKSMSLILWNSLDVFDPVLINQQDNFGNTALHYAALNWPQSIIQRLLELGACPAIPNCFGETALKRINSETLERFMGEYCIGTDEIDDDTDTDDENNDMDDTLNLFDEYDPTFTTNIRQSPVTFNYHFLSPYHKSREIYHNGLQKRGDVLADGERQEMTLNVLPEMDALLQISESKKHRYLLTHPLIKSYIWMKWKLINHFFHRDIRLQFNLIFCLTWYIFSNYGGHDYNQKCLFQPSVNLSVFCLNVHGIRIFDNNHPIAAAEAFDIPLSSGKSKTNITNDPHLEPFSVESASFQIPRNTRFCKDEKFAFNYPATTHESLHHGCNYASTWYVAFLIQATIQLFLICRGSRKTLKKKMKMKQYHFNGPSTLTLILLFWADLINLSLIALVLWKSEIILWLIVGAFLVTTTLNEFNQIASTRMRYFSKPGNYFDITEIIFVAIVLFVPNAYLVDPMTFTSIDVSKKLCEIRGLDIEEENNCSVKRGMSAVLIVLTWTRLLHGMAKHPRLEKFNIYFMMFYKVVWTFMKILMWYVLCIIAFGLGFYIMLHNDIGEAKLEVKDSLLTYNFFDSPWTSLLKSFVMFVGEIDYNNIPIGISYGMRHGNISSLFGYLFLLAFIFLISVVLGNLLNGLAVSDTGEIIKEALILHEASRVDTISYFETITLSNLAWINALGRICPWLDSFLQKHLAVVHKGIFIFHTHISPSNPKLTLPLHPPADHFDANARTSSCNMSCYLKKTKMQRKKYGSHEIAEEARDLLIGNIKNKQGKGRKK